MGERLYSSHGIHLEVRRQLKLFLCFSYLGSGGWTRFVKLEGTWYPLRHPASPNIASLQSPHFCFLGPIQVPSWPFHVRSRVRQESWLNETHYLMWSFEWGMSSSVGPCIWTLCLQSAALFEGGYRTSEARVLIEDLHQWKQDLKGFSLACVWIKCHWPASSSHYLLPPLPCHHRLRFWSRTQNKSFLLKLFLFIIFYQSNRHKISKMLFIHYWVACRNNNKCTLAVTHKIKILILIKAEKYRCMFPISWNWKCQI